MQRCDEPPVDQGRLLPDGARASAPDRRDGVEQVAAKQDSAPEPRPLLAQPGDDTVVEAMDGTASRGRGAVENREERLVPLTGEVLDLDPDLQSLERDQRLLEGRKGLSIGETVIGERGGGKVGEIADAPDDGVVVDQEDPVAGGVDVEFDPVGPQLRSPAKGRQRVLAGRARGPPVPEDPRLQLPSSAFLGSIQSFSLKTPRRNSRSSRVGVMVAM
jgi:hypothetical protein